MRAGVKLATGTDAGSTFVDHGVVAVEVELLHRFGLTPLAAIAAATRNAAEVIRLDQQIGTLQPGRVADVLIVEGDPERDVRDLQRVALVLKAGRNRPRAASLGCLTRQERRARHL